MLIISSSAVPNSSDPINIYLHITSVIHSTSVMVRQYVDIKANCQSTNKTECSYIIARFIRISISKLVYNT